MMSASPDVRSFWAAKDREDVQNVTSATITTSPRIREGRTMEGLRSSLARTWEQPKSSPRSPPNKAHLLPANIVTNSPFKERDRTPSPATSPVLSRRNTPSPILARGSMSSPARPESPYKSSFANTEANNKYGSLSRSKSVTFNELPEVRHMSACSYEPASSPYSTTDHSDSGEDVDEGNDSNMSDESDKHNDSWSNSIPTEKHLGDLDDPFTVTPSKILPKTPESVIGARPLPVIPVQRAKSPEQRIIATEQEDHRKSYPGLGLHLPGSSTKDLDKHDDQDHSMKYNADQAIIRRESQRNIYALDNSDCDSSEEAAVSMATMHDVSDKSAMSLQASPRSSPVLKKYSPSRSPELVISRAYVKEKMEQRRLAKEGKLYQGQDALKPRESLAPPLPHFDSFVRMNAAVTAEDERVPDSPISDVGFPTVVVPQRKVSDSTRPTTPVEQITTTAPEPQSGRAIHHEREKRLSNDLSQITGAKVSSKLTFAPVNYDGDDYDEDCANDQEIDLASVEKIPESLQTAVLESFLKEGINGNDTQDQTCLDDEKIDLADDEEVLRTLPEIPGVPVHHEDDAQDNGRQTPEGKPFDSRHMSLSLDFDGLGYESLGLEAFMTPEARPETPITSRTVALASPTKPSVENGSELDAWLHPTTVVNSETKTEVATITSRGLKLRTRPSMTPADADQLAQRRRKVSAEAEGLAEKRAQSQVVLDSDATLGRVRSESVAEAVSLETHLGHEGTIEEIVDGQDLTQSKEFSRPIQSLPRPILQPLQNDLSFSDINIAFDRVMQKQKKGYIVRQQSRVIHASAHHVEEKLQEEKDSNDPTGSDAPKGHMRQSSSVYTDISNVSGITRGSNENCDSHRRHGSRILVGVQMSPNPQLKSHNASTKDIYEIIDGGRLFVKVMHVRRLTLPIPSGEDSFFCCTLDNGKHCVTTPMHPLAGNVKINQEFELIADHDLEFILTLQAQYVPPVMPSRPKSTLGRLLNSPKKHRPTGSITSLSLAGHVGVDGSFARAHLALKHFRRKAFGRPHSISVPVLNEWARETTGIVKGVPQTRVRKPYKIGEIELQVLYVPPVDVEHRQALPTSLSQAVRDVRDAEWHNKLHCDGFLSQQGGDCPYWRRRHFKLVGPKLVAYHANTGQIRATINLAKALTITDDKNSLTEPNVTIGRGENKSRRKSGFAEREEGHLYVAEGFRIRFANGEFIDFYADSSSEKQRWIKALDDVIQKVPVIKDWARIVLESEAGTTPTSLQK